ncbi:MAG: alpha-L-fucosidase [Bryobacteraceae bacterium]|nr:alpha-L-fucosidase [Bryobacteraceae bacterium]
MRHRRLLLAAALACALCFGQSPGNRPERLEWFRDAGFGLFIHWSLDSQLGSVISHSLVGADADYARRFFVDLPRTFYPRKFEPRDWAVLARLAGFKYVVFTTKHHSGFCMYDTATTDFNIMNTPFRRDITAEIVNAFREQGVAPGFYFSPDDFHFLHKNGKTIARNIEEITPPGYPALLEYDKRQLRELLTNYGPIHVMFLDGPAEGLTEECWRLQPDTVVTRGAIHTPEQFVPGAPIDEPWESCITMGTQWQYKPTNDEYKSGTELIQLLIETRAKGGNLLLNIGPKPDGELPIEQEERLREIALWMFVNGESIYGVRPWVVTNEDNLWFTRRKNENTIYAFVTGPRWKLGEWREFHLRSVRAAADTTVSVLSQNDQVLEYQPDVVPKTTWRQDAQGLHIRAMRAQRLYNDRRWPNPVVLKITNASPGLIPPKISMKSARWDAASGTALLEGELLDPGKAASVEVGFQYRPQKRAVDLYEAGEPWKETEFVSRSAAGSYSVRLSGLDLTRGYDIRAVAKHPLITIYSAETALAPRP